MTNNQRFDIVPASAVSEADIGALLADAFGYERAAGWFAWKHRDCPWGPSIGVAALDGEGLAGIRLLLPWSLQFAGGAALAWRAVDASTARRSQGQGVFTTLNRALMEDRSTQSRPTMLFSTPNQNSRTGHARLGWTWLPEITHRLSYVSLRGAPALSPELDVSTYEPAKSPSGHISTAWTAESLLWRFDRRSGKSYNFGSLRSGDSPNGIVYRVDRRRGVDLVIVMVTWGSPAERGALVRAAARHAGARVVLDVSGAGAAPSGPRRGIRRGSSLVTIWDAGLGDESGWPIRQRDRWAFTFADLESVL